MTGLKRWEKFLLYSATPLFILGSALIIGGIYISPLAISPVAVCGVVVMAYSLASAAIVAYRDSN